MTKVGIDAIHFDVPKIYVDVEEFASNRGKEADKLRFGLGIQRISFPDVHQDAVTFALNAITKLIETENIDLNHISRLYIGTESAIDGSKPIGTFIQSALAQKHPNKNLEHLDVAEFKFACIGAVDALQNCLDFIRLNPHEQAIVIATDIAKYDLESSGEYTQGAGAIALLVKANPRILEIDSNVGISSEGVFDFFKPRRTYEKTEISVNSQDTSKAILEEEVNIYKEQPVFDGAYSNQCYMKRTQGAYENLKHKLSFSGKLYDTWDAILMHLPYCFQARRSFVETYAKENPELLNNQEGTSIAEKTKALSKTDDYKTLIKNKISPQETFSSLIGNIYTGSLFLGLLGHLYQSLSSTKKEQTIGLIAYGSGAKSKAFQGQLLSSFENVIQKLNFDEILTLPQPIDFETYVRLHTKSQKKSVVNPKKEWILQRVESTQLNLIGARYYQWID